MKRNKSFELMRIIAMLMVVILHYLHSTDKFITYDASLTGVRAAGTVIEMLCLVCVNSFIMLSGYNLSKSECRLGRLFRLMAQTWFYSLIIPLVLKAAGLPYIGMNRYDLRYYFLPITSGAYWFMTAYSIMYLLAPVMNSAVRNLSEKDLRRTILLLLVPFCFIKSICPVQLAFDRYGYDFGWFICLYLIGAYFRYHGFAFVTGKKKALTVYFGATAANIIWIILIKVFSLRMGGLKFYLSVPYDYNFVLVLLAAVGFFAAFAQNSPLPETAEKWIGRIAPFVLGVYLLHGHIDLIDSWEYYLEKLLGPAPEGFSFILHMLAAVVIVFAAGIFIDMIRSALFKGAERLLAKTGSRG